MSAILLTCSMVDGSGGIAGILTLQGIQLLYMDTIV